MTIISQPNGNGLIQYHVQSWGGVALRIVLENFIPLQQISIDNLYVFESSWNE